MPGAGGERDSAIFILLDSAKASTDTSSGRTIPTEQLFELAAEALASKMILECSLSCPCAEPDLIVDVDVDVDEIDYVEASPAKTSLVEAEVKAEVMTEGDEFIAAMRPQPRRHSGHGAYDAGGRRVRHSAQ